MSNRDLGTAILNIKIQFEKINTTELDKKVKDAVSQINQALSAAQQAKNVKQVGESVGASIVEGISEGVEKTTPEAKATVEGLGKKIESWFYKTLRINSPSKVTMDIGVSIVQGLIAGITRGKGGFQKAIEQFAKSGVDSLKGGLDQISELQIKIAKSVDLLNKERAKDPADQNPERIKNLIKIRQNLAEELRLLRERNKLEPDFNIDSFSKKRADEIERATRGLARQSTPIIKLVGALRQLDDTYLKSGKGLKNLTSAAGVAENEFNKYFKTLINNNKAAFEGAAGLTQLQTQYDYLEKRIRKNIKDTDLQREALEKLTASFEQQRKLVQGLAVDKAFTAASTKLSKPMGREQLVKTIQDLQRLIAELRGINVETGRFEKLLGKAQRQLKQMDARKLDNVRRMFHTITSGVNQFGEQLRRVSFILRDVGRQLMTVSKVGFSFIKPTITDFMAFEQAIIDVLAVTGDLTVGFQQASVSSSKLGSFILDLAGSTRFSAQEIAESAKTLALAGFSLNQITGSLRSLTLLAAATGADLASATNIVISTMSSFRLSAEETTGVVDIFTAAVTRSNTDISKLAEAMKVVAPSASMMNQEISQVVSGLGVLANAGIRGTSAGTGLSRIFTQLLEKGSELDEMLQGLGSSFDRINPEKVGLVDIIKEFERLNLSTTQYLGIFDLRAFRALQAILAQGSTRLEELNQAMSKASGLAQILAENRLNTLAGSVQLLNDGITALRISIGELVAKEMKDLVDFSRQLIDSFKELVKANQEETKALIKSLMGALAVTATIGTTLFGLGAAFSFLAAPLIGLGAILAGLNALLSGTINLIVVGLPTAFTTMLGPLGVSVAALSSLVGLFGLVSAGIAALTASIVLGTTAISVGVFQNFDKTLQYIKMWVSSVMSASESFAADFAKGWSSGVEEFNKAFEDFLVTLTKVGIVLTDKIGGTAAESMGAAIAAALTLGLTAVNKLIEAILHLEAQLKSLADLIQLLGIDLVFQAVAETVAKIGGLLNDLKPVFFVILKALAAIALYKASFVVLSRLGAALVGVLSRLGTALLALKMQAILAAAGPLALIIALQLLVDLIIKYLQYLEIIPVSAESLRAAQEKLNQAIEEQARLVERLNKLKEESIVLATAEAKAAVAASKGILDDLRERQKILQDISSADPAQLSEELSPQRQTEVQGNIEAQINKLRKAEQELSASLAENGPGGLDIMASDEVSAYEKQIAVLRDSISKLQIAADGYNRTIAYTNAALAGNSKVIKEGIQSETERAESLSNIVDEFDRLAGVVSSETIFSAFTTQGENGETKFFGELEKVIPMVDELNAAMGTDFKVTSWEDFAKLMEFVADKENGVSGALNQTREQLAQLKALEVVLAEFGDESFDVSTEEGRAAFAERQNRIKQELEMYRKIAQQQGESSDHMKNIEAIRKAIANEGKTQSQLQAEALDAEIQKRKDVIQQQIKYLEIQGKILENELKRADLTKEERASKEAALKASQDELAAMNDLAGKADEMSQRQRDKQEQDKLDARTEAALEVDKLTLETETDIDRRIALRTKINEAKWETELKRRLEALREIYDPEKDKAELEKAEADLRAAIDAARAKERADIVSEEKADEIKAQEDGMDQNNQMAEKRVDLENELLNNLGKQVNSLQQMAMLMQFIEILQRRKDQAALRALRELSKEEQKLVRMRLRGGGDDKAMAAIKAQEDLVAFMRGKVARNIGQAGAQGGDPRGIFNIQAFLARLNQAMTNFVDGLKANPLIIPAKFDKEMLVKSLKDAVKGFRIEDMAGMLGGGIGINSHTVGANFGTINHNDNRVINVNVNRLTADVARPLGMMNS